MRKLDINDIELIQKYSRLAHYDEYNSNIVTMMMWNHRYEMFIEEHEHFLLVLVNYKDNYGWLMPLCEEKYLLDALHCMKAFSDEHDMKLEIHGVISRVKDIFLSAGYDWIIKDNRNAYDYVYDVKMHASLNGKKMQKKRNHYNAFMKEYENRFDYHRISEDDFEAIYEFLEEWKENQKDIEAIEEEIIGIRYILSLFKELRLNGGCIYIDGKLEGFNLCSKLSDDMIQMHVEKANKNIRGLYVALLKYTLMNMDEEILYMNREDDLGIEELRKAKLDLQPIYLIEKVNMMEGQVDIIQANESYLPQIRKLFRESFLDESDETCDYFFDHLFDIKDCWLVVHKNQVLSMAQIRMLPILKNQKEILAPFIFGVATHPAYRKQGYMKKLFNHILSLYPDFILIQAYDWSLYTPFGFREAYQVKRGMFVSNGNGNGCECSDADHLLSLYEAHASTYDGIRIRDKKYYEEYLIPYTSLYGKVIANEKAYIVAYKQDDIWVVSQCAYIDEQALEQCLHSLPEGNIYVTTDMNCTVLESYTIRNMMMVKGNYDTSNHLYINEIL